MGRYEDLKALVRKHDHLYYVLANPSITTEFDCCPITTKQQSPSTIQTRNIFTCPTSSARPDERDPLVNVLFHYAINPSGNRGLTAGYGTNFSLSMILNPSAFVCYTEVRTHSSETPFFGSDPAKNLGSSHANTSKFSSRHNAGANLNFADGHVAWFKYSYVCADAVTKAADPGRPDIHWTYNGAPVP